MSYNTEYNTNSQSQVCHNSNTDLIPSNEFDKIRKYHPGICIEKLKIDLIPPPKQTQLNLVNLSTDFAFHIYGLEMALLPFFWARPGPLVHFLGPRPARCNKIIFRPVWARKYKLF